MPVCCNPTAYAAFKGLIDTIESAGALLQGATIIAQHALPDASPGDVSHRLAHIAQEIASSVHGSQPQAILARMHQHLFDELHFGGNSEEYYRLDNSLMPRVLDTHLGLPITLSLVYSNVARELGLRCWGLGVPGHFIVKVQAEHAPLLVDPFAAGRVLNLAEVKARLDKQFSHAMEWSDRFLEPVDNHYWLTRILQNLLTSYAHEHSYADMAAVLEFEMLLWPQESRLHRDLGLVLARAGHADQASAWLEYYLENNPHDPQRPGLEQLLATLV